MEPMVRWEGGYGHNEPNTTGTPKLFVVSLLVTMVLAPGRSTNKRRYFRLCPCWNEEIAQLLRLGYRQVHARIASTVLVYGKGRYVHISLRYPGAAPAEES